MNIFVFCWLAFGFILGIFCIAALIAIGANQFKRWLIRNKLL